MPDALANDKTDDFRLERFVIAQDDGETYRRALGELRRGQKQSHWMWFVFPQLAGLGSSAMAQRYAISGLPEARAYLEHPVLGARLRESTAAIVALAGSSAIDVLGPVDAQKLRSSMTLFARTAPDEPLFAGVLSQFFDGIEDDATTSRL